ncbi:hypothetical protein V500_07727 [Pseudogymnoascus sp. VKM F-4518 (FW-2643)]|nr:hypothetical protein V500_07727 [Pseudogymnoascus sp. VKM F-4518 (FW-2643)]
MYRHLEHFEGVSPVYDEAMTATARGPQRQEGRNDKGAATTRGWRQQRAATARGITSSPPHPVTPRRSCSSVICSPTGTSSAAVIM